MKISDIFREKGKELYGGDTQKNLSRFVEAHRQMYDLALQEIRAGRKQSHWMWYIFPQLRGLGCSRNADFYGISGQAEARMFLNHYILGEHLREITGAMLALEGRSAQDILGSIDALKFRSSMTLFDTVCPNGVFRQALQKYYDDKPDERTLVMLGLEMRERSGAAIVDGGIIGSIIGDVVGSRFEFNNVRSTRFDLFTPESCFTDDTVMTLAVADWLLGGASLESVMTGWGENFPNAGYGGMFYDWLFGNREKVPYNSCGNGAGMRVGPCGYFARTLDEALDLAKQSAEVTHNHSEGIKGAQAIAAAIFLARQHTPKEEIRDYVEQAFGYNLHRTCDEIRPDYSFDVTCQGSCPEAIIAFLDSHDYESAIRLAVSLGGDSDTIACMTGGIAAACYGIPAAIVEEAMTFLPVAMKQLIRRFDEACAAR